MKHFPRPTVDLKVAKLFRSIHSILSSAGFLFQRKDRNITGKLQNEKNYKTRTMSMAKMSEKIESLIMLNKKMCYENILIKFLVILSVD